MNEKFTNSDGNENVAGKLNQVVEQTHVNSQFVAELETKLRSTRRPRTGRFVALFRQVSPVVRWVALMALLGLVLSLSIKTLIPAPQPAEPLTASPQGNGETTTPTPGDPGTPPPPQGESYEYGAAKLIMNAPFPNAPAQASVYKLLDAQPATAEYARTLADQFGIAGQTYLTEDWSGETVFLVTDGKQELLVYTENMYAYTSDIVKYSRRFNGPSDLPYEDAEATIREFMEAHGFDFDFRIKTTDRVGVYELQQLAPDGIPVASSSMSMTLRENGEILYIYASLLKFESVAVGSYGITTAEESLHQMIDDSFAVGVISGGGISIPDDLPSPQFWYYEYPDDQTVTAYGNITSYPAAEAGTPAIILINKVPVSGNTEGMEALPDSAFVQATGQFIVENGIRTFHVETWDQNAQYTCASGPARQVGEQIIVTSQGETTSEYALVDPPEDLPLGVSTEFPDAQLIPCGVIVDEQFRWNEISYYFDPSQMGGGGGGGGYFHRLNLSGTPVSFPTGVPTQSTYDPEEFANFLSYIVQPGDTLASIASTYNVSAEDIRLANNMSESQVTVDSTLTIPTTRLEGERGTVVVQVFENSEGRRRTRYMFTGEEILSNYELKGDNLEDLQKVANRPIKVWGSIGNNEEGVTFITMEKFEVIYPDLQFQILTGTQESTTINGEDVVLFTTGGMTYIQMDTTGTYIVPSPGHLEDAEKINIEALRVPDETYAGYPALRVFSVGPAIDPTTGDPVELEPIADQIEVMPDPWGDNEPYSAPDIFIEEVELVYYFCDAFLENEDEDPPPPQPYLQPVWQFQGHTENGAGSGMIVQALRQEYLLPYEP